MVVWEFGFGSLVGFLGLCFYVDGVWGLRCGAFGDFLDWGCIHKQKNNPRNKNGALVPTLISL